VVFFHFALTLDLLDFFAKGRCRTLRSSKCWPKEFFEFVKKSERVVVHFGRAATERCAVLDRHLRETAQTHFETHFLESGLRARAVTAAALQRPDVADTHAD